MQRRFGLAIATITGFVTVAGLGLTGSAQAASVPHSGGTLTELSTGINPTIDPALNLLTSTTDAQPLEAVYGPGLVYLDSYTGNVKMGFAQSLTSKDHGHTWKLVLRPGLKFSDGTSFDAAAVKFNIDRMALPATGSPLQSAAAQLATAVVNKTTLRITCTPTNALFPTIMAYDFAMIASPAALASEGTGYGSHPVGAGPFQVQAFQYGISWTFVRNPHYKQFAPHQPYLDGITITTLSSTQQQITSLQLGESQTAVDANVQQVNGEKAVGMTVIAPPQPKMYEIVFNPNIAPFNNIIAREAVYYALDRAVAGDTWTPDQPVLTNMFGPRSPFFNKKYNFPAQDTVKAQQLFDQLAAGGHPLNFTFTWLTGSSNGPLGSYVVGALSQFKNVTVTQTAVPTAQYNAAKTGGTFQATGASINTGMIPGAFQAFMTGGSINYGRWSDAVMDQTLVKLQSTTSLSQQKKLWATVQERVLSQFPNIFLEKGIEGYAYNAKQVGGVTTTQFGTTAFFGPLYRK